MSEETGRISVAEQAKLKLGVDLERLRREISAGIEKQLETLDSDDPERSETKHEKSPAEVAETEVIDLSESSRSEPAELKK